MGGQLQELLRDVDRKLDLVEIMVKDLKEDNRDKEKQIGELRERVAALEEAKRWTGEERREVANRLGSGDKTFERIDYQVKEAEAIATRAYETAKTALDAIDAHTDGDHGTTKKRKNRFWKWAEILAPFVIPALISGVGWLYYHLRFLAELAAKEGRP